MPTGQRTCQDEHANPWRTAVNCPLCRLYVTNPRYNTFWGGDGRVGPFSPSRYCTHRGEAIGQLVDGPGCKRRLVRLKLFACAKHEACTLAREVDGFACCQVCPDRSAVEGIVQVAPERLLPSRHQFNCSLVEYQGRTLLAYRRHWSRAEVALAELDADMQPIRNWQLGLPRQGRCAVGREDPRLFVHQGQLHLVFAGYDGRATHQLLAILGDDFEIDAFWYPHYERRGPWEKNWGFFAWENELLCVYTIAPIHRVLRIVGTQAYSLCEVRWEPRWSGGYLRGGAPPVLYEGEYYSFFHGKIDDGAASLYSLGCYTFDAQPPFAPRRLTREPLLWPDPLRKPAFWHPDVVYPSGAIRQGEKWLVSCGQQDHYSDIVVLDTLKLEEWLEPA
jgi:predicted GH43/DUF377 family glycosyl hydrolase